MEASLGSTAMIRNQLEWLLSCTEPWTRYRALIDLSGRTEKDADVVAARQEMCSHLLVQGLIAGCGEWGKRPILRHNDASHPRRSRDVSASLGKPQQVQILSPWLTYLVLRIQQRLNSAPTILEINP
jgi:hypothetical protein